MKIIFLDIDGVLNSSNFLYKKNKKKNGERALNQIDPKTIKLLNKIIEITNAKIVISSAWRILYSVEEITRFLKYHKLVGEIIDETPKGISGKRGDEIQDWLNHNTKKYNIESFAIIDDNSDMVHLKHKLIQTKFETGLLKEHIEKVIEILNKEQTKG